MNLAQRLITLSLRAYQLAVSPVLHFVAGPLCGCRFTPTCSVYAAQAVREHGVARGAALTVGRLCRCHPWGGCGHDPVPGVANQYSVLSAQSVVPSRGSAK